MEVSTFLAFDSFLIQPSCQHHPELPITNQSDTGSYYRHTTPISCDLPGLPCERLDLPDTFRQSVGLRA